MGNRSARVNDCFRNSDKKKGICEKMTLEVIHAKIFKASLVKIWVKNILGRGNSWCKVPQIKYA